MLFLFVFFVLFVDDLSGRLPMEFGFLSTKVAQRGFAPSRSHMPVTGR
jgi:hypothetical protein